MREGTLSPRRSGHAARIRFFFFSSRRRHTRFDCDWSSDVCSSDLGPGVDQRRLGKRVWLYNGQRNARWMGTAAEYIALSVDLVTELPDHVSFAERSEERRVGKECRSRGSPDH